MVVYAGWVCVSGLRRTTPGFVHDLSVIAESPDGIDRVEFAIAANGSPHSTLTASSESIRIPNYSDKPGRMPGVTSGCSPFIGWGVGLDLSTVPAGTIVVTATAFDGLGGSYAVPETMTVYNDTDGGDRRPRITAELYCDSAGSDSNNGLSWGTAVKSPMRAIQIARDSGTGEIGGVRINYRGTFTNLSGGIFPETQTSGQWWCEHVADASGAYFNPPGDPAPIGPRQIYSGKTGGGVTTRHRWIGFRMGRSLVCYNFGGTVINWMDGCYGQAENYLGPSRWTVNYVTGGVSGIQWGNGGGAPPIAYYTGCLAAGALVGFEQSAKLYDSVCEDFIGIATKIGSISPSGVVVCNYIMRRQRYRPRLVEGYVRMDGSSSGFPCPSLVITKPNATTARITGPVGGYDFSIDAAALVGSERYGLRFDSVGFGLSNGLGLEVTAVGNTGGAPWVEVTAPSATLGSVAAGVGSFYTASKTTGANYWFVHPDGIQIERAGNRDIFSDCAIYDCDGMQSYFMSAQPQNLCLWRNLRDDGSGGNVMNWNGGATCTSAYLKNLTIVGQWQCSASSYAGTVVENCVFGSAGSNVGSSPSLGATVRYCHWIGGATVGTNATSGSWFAGAAAVTPFPFAPATTGNGSPSVADLSTWAYSLSGSTRGVLKNVGNLDWGVGVTAAGSGPAGVTVAAPTGNMLAGALLSDATAVPGLTFDGPRGAVLVGAVLSMGDSLTRPGWLMGVGAPGGVLQAGTVAAVLAGDGAVACDVLAPTGDVLAHGLLAGAPPPDVAVAAGSGSLVAHALLAGDPPPDIEAAAPTGDIAIGVLIASAGPADIAIVAPTGTMLPAPAMVGTLLETIQARAAEGYLRVGEELPTPPATTPTRTPRERLRLLPGSLWGRSAPRRRWGR